MENVTGIIDALCAKLGVTMENLIPAVAEFGKYDCQLTARICSYFIVVGILCLIIAFTLEKTNRGWDGLFFIVGILAVVIAGFVLILALATLNEWNNFPEVMAYKYILQLMR